MPRRKKSGATLAQDKSGVSDAASNDVERQAIEARKRRTVECERMVQMALRPILDKYRCRLGTIQEIMDGNPGITRIIVIAND